MSKNANKIYKAIVKAFEAGGEPSGRAMYDTYFWQTGDIFTKYKASVDAELIRNGYGGCIVYH